MATKEEIKEFFDSFAKERIELKSSFGELYNKNRLVSLIVGQTGIEHDDRILDVGCGSGEHLTLLENFGFRNLFGIDISPNMVKIAKKTCDYAKLSLGDIENTGFPSNFFDAVLCISTLHYMPRVENVLNEIKRILKKDGKLVIESYNPTGGKFKNMFSRKNKCSFYYQPKNKSFDWSLNTFVDLLSNSGFKVDYSKTYGFVFSSCPAYFLPFNILAQNIIEKTPLAIFGREFLIIAHKVTK